MRRTWTTLIALAAVSVVLFVLVLPPRSVALDASRWSGLASRTVAGAYHVHTTRSDGAADTLTVAAAAGRAGLKFVIFTDHGDATRPPDPPIYLSGVLCLDAVEISTDQGHYVALDMPRAPYPLGGAAGAVAEDVSRLGGFGIAAHPDSAKLPLQWSDPSVPVDGIEWLNGDSEWRNESRAALVRAGLAYLVRPAPALGMLLDRPVTLDRWDRLTSARPVVALAGADAHGGIGRRAEDGSRSGFLGIPSYEASFRAFSNRVVLRRALSGDAAADARGVYGAIRQGHVFAAIDAFAAPGLLDFHAEDSSRAIVAQMGDAIGSGEVTLVARALMPRGAQVILYRAGQEVARTGGELRWSTGGVAGAYRVEVHLPSAPGEPPMPWLVSNPIYVGRVSGARAPEAPAPAPRAPRAFGAPPAPEAAWRIERDPSSSGILRTAPDGATLEYELGGGGRHSQFVALATDLHDQPFEAIRVTLASDRAMRVSVQARRSDGLRWGRSVYVDPTGVEALVTLDTLQPLDPGAAGHPDPTTVTSVLLVVDLTNAAPGHKGVLRVGSFAVSGRQ